MKFLLIILIFLLSSCGTVKPEDTELICVTVHYVNGDSTNRWYRVDKERSELSVATRKGSYWLGYVSNHPNRIGAQREIVLECGVVWFTYCEKNIKSK